MPRASCNKIREGSKHSERRSACETESAAEKKKEEERKLERASEEARETYNHRNSEDKSDHMRARQRQRLTNASSACLNHFSSRMNMLHRLRKLQGELRGCRELRATIREGSKHGEEEDGAHAEDLTAAEKENGKLDGTTKRLGSCMEGRRCPTGLPYGRRPPTCPRSACLASETGANRGLANLLLAPQPLRKSQSVG